MEIPKTAFLWLFSCSQNNTEPSTRVTMVVYLHYTDLWAKNIRFPSRHWWLQNLNTAGSDVATKILRPLPSSLVGFFSVSERQMTWALQSLSAQPSSGQSLWPEPEDLSSLVNVSQTLAVVEDSPCRNQTQDAAINLGHGSLSVLDCLDLTGAPYIGLLCPVTVSPSLHNSRECLWPTDPRSKAMKCPK